MCLRAKYPLAHVNELMNTFGRDIMIGYDIGCGFTSTARGSAKLGAKVTDLNTKFCVGAFHGHAHNRLCQTRFLCRYQAGVGLEDFEGCERCFAESNRVASCTRHASRFFRRMAIIHHYERWNRDKFAELGVWRCVALMADEVAEIFKQVFVLHATPPEPVTQSQNTSRSYEAS